MAAQDEKKVEEKLEDLKVDDLKDRCRDAGLKVSGTKAELIARLKEKSDDKAGAKKDESDSDSDKDDKKDDKDDKAKEGDKSDEKDAKKDVDMKDGDDEKMGGGDKKEEKVEEMTIEVGMLLEGFFVDPKKGDFWYEVKVLEVKKGDDETLYHIKWTYDDDPKNVSDLPRSKLRKVGGAPLDAKKEEKSDDELVICVAMLLEGKFKDPKKADRWFECKILEIIDGDGDEKTYKVQWTYDDDKNESVLKKDEIRKPGGGKKDSGAPPEKVDKLSMSLDDLISTDSKPKGRGKGKDKDKGGSSWGGGGGGKGSGGGDKWGGSGGSSWKDSSSQSWSKDDSGGYGAKKSWEAPASKSWGGGDDKWGSKKPAWDSGDKYGKSSYGDKSYGGGSSKYDKYDSKPSYESKGYDKYDSKGSHDDKYSRDKGGERDRRDTKADDDRDRRRDSGRDGGGSSFRTWGSGGGRDAPAKAPVEGATVVVSGIGGLRVDARDLEKAFATVGTVESAVMKGANAMITFSSRRCATEAVRRFHGGQLNDRTIDVALEGEAPARHKASGGGGRSRSPRQAEREPPRGSRAPAASGRSRSRGRTGGSSQAAAKPTNSRPAAGGGGRPDDRRRARSPSPRGAARRPYR